MISTIVYFLFKVILVTILLVAMVFVLFGIGHLHRQDNQYEIKETVRLRKDVEKSRRVISRHGVFNGFLVRRR